MKPTVTIVVVPRERFSYSADSLESIYSNTEFPFELTYVDGNSPFEVKKYLEKMACQRGFELIRHEKYLSPNQARNIGLKSVKTKYVVFIDNDVLVSKGWLKNLVEAAESTNAWAVGPLTLAGEDFKTVHMAGGIIELKEKNGQTWMIQRRPFMNLPFKKVLSDIKSGETQLLEFHCMLVNMDAFNELGLLDEHFMSMCEEDDFCMDITKAKQRIYFESKAVVSYVPPSSKTLTASDLPFFFIRWSDAWCDITLRRCRKEWNLTQDSPFLKHTQDFVKNHRYLAYSKAKNNNQSVLGNHFVYVSKRLILGEFMKSWMNQRAKAMITMTDNS